MEKQTYSRQQIVSSLMKIGHGDLSVYLKDVMPAAKEDAELFAHLVTWNQLNGKVRDSKVAYPPIALRGLAKKDDELAENAVANMASLAPRELYRSYQFSKELTQNGHNISCGYRRMLEWALKRYIQVREIDPDWWDSAVVRNRKAMLGLYTVAHIKPNSRAQKILFEKNYPKSSVFAVIKDLKKMQPPEAAGMILKYNIPLTVAIGSVAKARDPDILLALIEGMSGNELITNTNMLERLGVFDNPVLKSTYDSSLERARKDKRVDVLKVSRAAETIDGKIAKKLSKIQESRARALGGIEGDWLILGDCSYSMRESIEIARQAAAFLANQIKGKVYLVFFNTMPKFYDVTSKTLAEVQIQTKRIDAFGNTSIGCGLDYIKERGIIVNGIVIVSDGGENTAPFFSEIYQKYVQQTGIEPTVYLFHVPGDPNYLIDSMKEIEFFEWGKHVDYYSLPNVIFTLKANRYALLDEIMQTKLLTFSKVFN